VPLRRRASAHFIRPISAGDEEALQRFIRELSQASRYTRFMSALRELPGHMLDRFLHPAPGREAVLVADSAKDGIVGLAQYVADESGEGCEVAVVISDEWQRQGLGMEMLDALMDVASENGVRHFHADVLADNHPMRALARKTGCEIRTTQSAPFVVQIWRSLVSAVPASGVRAWQ
jgi:acetyltransferase